MDILYSLCSGSKENIHEASRGTIRKMLVHKVVHNHLI
jgi:hypothetical protein